MTRNTCPGGVQPDKGTVRAGSGAAPTLVAGPVQNGAGPVRRRGHCLGRHPARLGRHRGDRRRSAGGRDSSRAGGSTSVAGGRACRRPPGCRRTHGRSRRSSRDSICPGGSLFRGTGSSARSRAVTRSNDWRLPAMYATVRPTGRPATRSCWKSASRTGTTGTRPWSSGSGASPSSRISRTAIP